MPLLPDVSLQDDALPLTVVRPIPARSIIAGLATALLCVCLFAYFSEVPRREQLQGWFEPAGGELLARTPVDARVKSVHRAGDSLKAGDAVAVLSQSGPAEEGDRETLTPVLVDRDSVVLTANVANGSMVRQGDVIAQLSAKNSPLKAVLVIPARAAAQIRTNQPVQLKLAAYPYETFGALKGVVESVDKVSMRPADSRLLSRAPGDKQQAVLRAVVRIDEVPEAILRGGASLDVGMELTASVEVDRRTLLAWLLSPLLRRFD